MDLCHNFLYRPSSIFSTYPRITYISCHYKMCKEKAKKKPMYVFIWYRFFFSSHVLLMLACIDVHYDDDNFKIPSVDCLLVYLLILRLRTIKTNKQRKWIGLSHKLQQRTFHLRGDFSKWMSPLLIGSYRIVSKSTFTNFSFLSFHFYIRLASSCLNIIIR